MRSGNDGGARVVRRCESGDGEFAVVRGVQGDLSDPLRALAECRGQVAVLAQSLVACSRSAVELLAELRAICAALPPASDAGPASVDIVRRTQQLSTDDSAPRLQESTRRIAGAIVSLRRKLGDTFPLQAKAISGECGVKERTVNYQLKKHEGRLWMRDQKAGPTLLPDGKQLAKQAPARR